MDISQHLHPYSQPISYSNYDQAIIVVPQLFPYSTPTTSSNYTAAIGDVPQLLQQDYSEYSNYYPAVQVNMQHQYDPGSSNNESRELLTDIIPILPQISPEATFYDELQLSPPYFEAHTQETDSPHNELSIESINNEEHLRAHENEEEELPDVLDITLFECRWDSCLLVFTAHEELTKHVKECHQPSFGVICLWDGCFRDKNPFKCRYMLRKHVMVHTDEKPNKCTLPSCGKAFRRREELKVHLRSHTGERPYKCNYCEKAFTNTSDKLRHEGRRHSDQKRFRCDVVNECAKVYKDPSSLRKHIIYSHGAHLHEELVQRRVKARKERGDKRKKKGNTKGDDTLDPKNKEAASEGTLLKDTTSDKIEQSWEEYVSATATVRPTSIDAQGQPLSKGQECAATHLGNDSNILKEIEFHRQSVVAVLEYFDGHHADAYKTKSVQNMHGTEDKSRRATKRKIDGNRINEDFPMPKRKDSLLPESSNLREQRNNVTATWDLAKFCSRFFQPDRTEDMQGTEDGLPDLDGPYNSEHL